MVAAVNADRATAGEGPADGPRDPLSGARGPQL